MKRWIFLAVLVFAGSAVAQNPQQLWGLIYNLVPPMLSDRQTTVWQGDSSGKVRMNGLGPPPACDGTIDLSTGCVLPTFRGL